MARGNLGKEGPNTDVRNLTSTALCPHAIGFKSPPILLVISCARSEMKRILRFDFWAVMEIGASMFTLGSNPLGSLERRIPNPLPSLRLVDQLSRSLLLCAFLRYSYGLFGSDADTVHVPLLVRANLASPLRLSSVLLVPPRRRLHRNMPSSRNYVIELAHSFLCPLPINRVTKCKYSLIPSDIGD